MEMAEKNSKQNYSNWYSTAPYTRSSVMIQEAPLPVHADFTHYQCLCLTSVFRECNSLNIRQVHLNSVGKSIAKVG